MIDRKNKHAFVLVACGLVAAIAIPGCSGNDASNDDDYSDATWSSALSEDNGAVLEEEAGDQDPDDAVDETNDASEADDVDADVESDAVASMPDGSTAAQSDDGLRFDNAIGANQYKNAVASACADPGVIRLENPTRYLAACTGNGYPLLESNDLVHWSNAGHLFKASTRPTWGAGDWWAPEIHHIGSGLVAYYAALSKKRGRICLGAAHQQKDGTWKDIGRPLLCNKHVGLIDPHVMSNGNRHYLYFKTDGNGLTPKEPSVIYGHELGADGVSFVPGKSKPLIRNRLKWEGDVVEAPWVEQRGKYTYLYYSGFRYCDGTYGVGVARALSPLGNFHKRGAPILRTNAAFYGPGHNSIVSAGGHDWIVYHAWKGQHDCSTKGADRELLIDRVSWSGGWPSVNNGTPSRGVHSAP